MTTIAITIQSICDGLGHWQVSATDGGATVKLSIDWADMQVPLTSEELQQITLLILRARYAGIPVHALGDLLLNGGTV